MKLVIAYIRNECAEAVMRRLHEAGVAGLTAYSVRGMSGEKSLSLYSKHPFEIHHLPDSVKLEVICADESVDDLIKSIVQAGRTGNPGDGIIAIQDVERTMRIRDCLSPEDLNAKKGL